MLLVSTTFTTKALRLSCIVGLLLLSLYAKAQVTLSLEYTEQNNTTTIGAGNVFTMQMKYSASSTTTNITGAKMVINLPDQIIDAFTFTGTTHAPASNFAFDNTPGAKKLTITFIDPLPSGSNGTLEATFLTANGTVPNGTVVTTNAEFTSNGGFTSGVKNYAITLTADQYICAEKRFVGGGAVNNNTVYAIRITGNQLSYGEVPYGYLNATNVIITDNLPAGTQFVSAKLVDSQGGTVASTINQSGGVITATIPDLIALRSGNFNWAVPAYELIITVKYNTPTFAAGQTVTNSSSITFTPYGRAPVTVTDGNKVSANACVNDLKEVTTLAAPTVNATFSKTLGYGSSTSLYPGQMVTYCINFENTGNVDLANVQIIENIPSNLRYAGRRFDNASAVDHFEYQTNLNSTWQTTTLLTNDPGPNPGNPAEYYTKLKIVLVSPFPANTSLFGTNNNAACPLFQFVPATEVTSDVPVTNCAEWTSTTTGIPTSRTACAETVILKPRSTTAIAFLRTDYSPACSSPFTIGQILTSTVTLSTDQGGGDMVEPVLMIFPGPANYFEYVPGSATFNAGTSSLTVTPTFTYLPNYAGTGRFLLRWTFPAGTKLPHGTNISVSAQVKLTNSGTSGHVIEGYASSKYNDPFTHYNGGGPIMVTDTYDLNGNGRTTDTLGTQEASYQSCPITVSSSASMESIKWVKGQLDSDYSRYPASGNTVRGGKADYKLIVRNTGNIPMTSISITDILPFVGDMGVIDLSPRNTQWRPNLAGPITAPSGITVYYSTAGNPCRNDMKPSNASTPFPTGCTTPNWTTVPPTDITTVQSLRFDFGTIVIQPGDSLQLNWPMRAPVDAPINGEIAWNSFGFIATRTDNNTQLLAAEPIKVGIKLAAPAPAFYGDYVWYDTNHNGLQDAGEQGVDGVKVILFKDNGDNTANPATDTEIAFTVTGNGGKYLFPNLEPGNYYALFFPPASYSVSPANQGTNDAIDSDGTVTTYQGKPAYITAITQLDALEEDLTWDLGIYCGFTPTVSSNSPVSVGSTLSLSASGGSSYSWTGPNGFVSTSPNPTIPNVTTANAGTYKVTIDNNGCYATLTVDVLVGNCVKPNAGTDVRICTPVTSATLTAAATGQTWSVQTGNPASATIAQNGQVSGLTTNGTYRFILSAGAGCSDTVQVIRGGLSLTVTPGTCNTATNQYSVSGTVLLTNPPAGTLTITDGALSTTATVATSTTGVSFSLNGAVSGSGSHTVTATLSGCGNASTTYTAPASCSVAPALAVTVTPGTCNTATNQYGVTGSISLTAASAGTLTITDGTSTTTVAVTAGQSSVSFSLTGLASGSGSHTVTVSGTGYAPASTTYNAPVSCTVNVAISTTAGSCIPATNQYSVSGTLSLTNAVAGTATITDGTSTTTVTVSAGATSVPYTLAGLASGTGSHTVTVSYAGKTASTTYTAPASCTLGVGLVITPGVCQSATNQYTLTGTLSLTNAQAGTATFTDGVRSTTVAVSAGQTSVGFSLTGLASGTGSHTLTASFNGNTQSQTYTAPASCTVAVAITVTPNSCTPATNQYSVSVTLSLTNASAGTATITDGSYSTTVAVSAGASSVPYSLTGLTSGTGSHTVTVSYAGKTASTTYTAPASCSVAPALALTVTPGACIPATNQYAVSGTISLTAAPAGTLTITDGTSTTTVSVTAGQTSASFNLAGLNSGTGSHTVTISGTGYTPVSQIYTAPVSCSIAPPCGLNVAVTPGVCNTATNQYSVTGMVSATNAIGTQVVTITDGATSTTISLVGNGPASFTLAGLSSNGAVHNVVVSATTCGQSSTTYTAPASCTVGISITATPGVCQTATNGYSVSGILSLTNAVAGIASITDGTSTTTVAVNAGLTSVPYTLTGLNTGTGSHTVTVNYAGKIASTTYTAPVPCSLTVGIAISVTPGVCQSATNGYSITGTLSLTNAPAGTATITDGVTSTTVTVTAGATAVPFSMSGLVSDGVGHTVTVSFAGRTAQQTYTAPVSCVCPPAKCVPISIRKIR